MGDPSDIEALLAKAQPYRQRLNTLDRIEVQAAQPWYKRAWSWIADAHKLVTIFAAICGASVAAHAYIAGLITKDNLKAEVTQAVAAAVLDTRARVTTLEDHTSGLPEWRRDTSEKVVRQDERIRAVEKLSEKTEARLDRIGKR